MEDFDLYESDIKNDNLVVRLQKRYIRDAENPLEYYSDEEFKKRFRFKKITTSSLQAQMDLHQLTICSISILCFAVCFYNI